MIAEKLVIKPDSSKRVVNLMEAVVPATSSPSAVDARWFREARFGMFVHYGLYSILGRGEWAMYFEKIPTAEYNVLADRFTAENFDADEVVALAKNAGSGYVVLGARHHEGFCLWDTKTTDFNSVKTAAGRDLIREFVDACGRAGMRVGIYFSVMSWQWPAIISGPAKDPEGWRAMVAETHEQVRELMTDYGQIDYLWYDGCVVPGLGDATIRAKHWRSRELNAMVRRLQPGILINDRAALPEDVTTPEQNLTPAPRGRVWECCQTMGNHWGWHHAEVELKPARELIEQLIFCARYGGNYLLNVGPEASGRVPAEQAERMQAIGRWMEINGESIRDSERTPYTEAQHLIGSATARERTLYFHVARWPAAPVVVAGITVPVVSVNVLGCEDALSFTQAGDGCVTLHRLPLAAPIDTVIVLAVTLQRPPAPTPPPSLLVEHHTGRHEPAEGIIHAIEEWRMNARQTLRFKVPARGHYHLELGIISKKAQRVSTSLSNHRSEVLEVGCGNYPTTLRMNDLLLAQGEHELLVEASQADFGIYVWRLQPVWRTLPPRLWKTTGPFPTEYGPQGTPAEVRAALSTVFPPELEKDYDLQPGWKSNSGEGGTVNLGLLCESDDPGVCYARLTVISPHERDLAVLLGCDWWANLFVNGRLVISERDAKDFLGDGAWFNGWKPAPALVRLRTGRNVILVKCHPGSTDNWFTFYINDPGDLILDAGSL